MAKFQSTTPGYKNRHGQVVIARTGFPSESFAGQIIYHLRCSFCNHDYGSAGKDIHLRRCPNHQNGMKGEPLRVAGANLFSLEGG